MNLDKGTLLERNIDNYPIELRLRLKCVEEYRNFKTDKTYDAICVDLEHNGTPHYFVWVTPSYCDFVFGGVLHDHFIAV